MIVIEFEIITTMRHYCYYWDVVDFVSQQRVIHEEVSLTHFYWLMWHGSGYFLNATEFRVFDEGLNSLQCCARLIFDALFDVPLPCSASFLRSRH